PTGQAIVEGDLRVRSETWDWFTAPGTFTDDYTYAHARLRLRLGYKDPKSFEGMVEVQDVQMIGLPTRAIGPGAIGQMGPGAITFAHAGTQSPNTIGLRQAYLKIGDIDRFQVQLGRMEFGNAAEVMPRDPSLAALKRSRLKDRLIGTFEFSPYSRTFDGLRLDGDTGDFHITGFVARPTQGGFEPDFGTEIDRVLISDLSLTAKNGTLLPDGEAQVFWIHYDDDRPVPQVDNRPPALRGMIGATGGNHIDTVGLHFLHKLGENGDLLLWYAHQGGRWGALTQRADAFSAELGYQFKDVTAKPWVRAGYSYYSGDDNPADGVHGTFNPLLPTIRVYALTPFYTESNLRDAFAQVMLKPTDQTSVRVDLHSLSLASSADLWYVGAGATRRTGAINGFAGRPSGGNSDLATLLDLGVEHQFDDNHKLALYFGHVFGGSVIRTTYPVNPDGNFFFVEYNLRLP
ncbi:MAG: alginate export family protein, partial [Candidatus Eremiobacterota bacterium]